MCERHYTTGIDILDFPLGEDFDFLPNIQEKKKNPKPTMPIIRRPKPETQKKHIRKDGKK